LEGKRVPNTVYITTTWRGISVLAQTTVVTEMYRENWIRRADCLREGDLWVMVSEAPEKWEGKGLRITGMRSTPQTATTKSRHARRCDKPTSSATRVIVPMCVRVRMCVTVEGGAPYGVRGVRVEMSGAP
jgi:hypothetical protein